MFFIYILEKMELVSLHTSTSTSNKVSNIIKRHIDKRELLLICILLLSHNLIFFRFIFINIWFYSCLIL